MAILKKQESRVGSQQSAGLKIRRFFLVFLVLFTAHRSLFTVVPVHAARIKEISHFEGIRQNHLIGYGLVIGLDGTGDKSGSDFTIKSLVNMLNRLGVKVESSSVKVKNVAAVIVTAELSPFKQPGDRIDAVVSSIGDAKSLQGGTLLFTPLRGADSEIYAVAQGAVSVGGFIGGGEGASVQKNHLTVGRIPDGALVEKEIPLQFGSDVFLALKQFDFTTSNKMAQTINAAFGSDVASAMDGARLKLNVPDEYRNRIVEFFAKVETLNVPVDAVSKVVINERTGTIIIGENVKVSTVAVSHGNLTVEVKTRFRVSQPPPFSRGGETVVVPESEVKVEEQKARLLLVEQGVSLGDLVGALNALGVTPRDLIAILQAIKAAGALQAEIDII